MSLQVNAQSQGIGANLMQKADKDQNGQLNAKELPAFVEALLAQIFGGKQGQGQGQAAANSRAAAPVSGIAAAPNPGVDQFTPQQGKVLPGPAPNQGGILPPVQKKAGTMGTQMGAQNSNMSEQERIALLEGQLEKISQVQARADIGLTQPGDAKILEQHHKLMKSNPDLFMPPTNDPTSSDAQWARNDFKNELALVNGGVGNLKGGANGFGATNPVLEGHIDYLKKLIGKGNENEGQIM